MTLVVLLPSFVAAAFAVFKDHRQALVLWALPCLLLLPSYYTHKFSGIPVINFHNYLLAVVMAGAVISSDRKLLSFHAVDFLVVFFALWCVYSEFETKGFAEGRNMLAVKMMGVLAPYYLGKMMARENGYLIGTFVVLGVVGAFIGFVSPYEARFGQNPFDFWRRFWPAGVPWDGALYRFGMRRVAGPFAHPICQGFFFSMAIPLATWINHLEFPKKKWGRRSMMLGLVMGLFFCGSRGPWLGTILALSFPAICWRKARSTIAIVMVVMAVLGPFLIWDQIEAYASIERGQATSESQETAAYRWEMLENYLEVVDESPVIGYGKDQIPIVKGLKSIDNQYLFLALIHGLPAAWAFLACMFIPGLIVLIAGLRHAWNDPIARLATVLGGILFGAIFTQITVFAGTQTEQILFLIIGAAMAIATRLNQRLTNSRMS